VLSSAELEIGATYLVYNGAAPPAPPWTACIPRGPTPSAPRPAASPWRG